MEKFRASLPIDPRKPRNFSTLNDLQYTVASYVTFSLAYSRLFKKRSAVLAGLVIFMQHGSLSGKMPVASYEIATIVFFKELMNHSISKSLILHTSLMDSVPI